MSVTDDKPQGLTLDAKPPFTFGLGLQGELVIGFSMGGIPTHLVVPSAELSTLRRGLEESRTIQETLSAKPPQQGAH